MASDTAATASTNDLATRWLVNLGLDVSKATLGLYLLGTVVSLFYYSRFSILTLDLIRSQSILIGCYVISAYCVIPVTVLWLCKKIANVWLAIAIIFVTTGVLDGAILHLAEYRGFAMVLPSAVMFALQLSFFISIESVVRTLRERDILVQFTLVPPKARSSILLIACLFHFSYVLFPRIPMYLGGARPMRVLVFTKTANLASVRMSGLKPTRNFNGTMDAFPMDLLYESDKDAYFLTEIKANGAVLDHLVTRIHKDEIQRVDYQTPQWVTWR